MKKLYFLISCLLLIYANSFSQASFTVSGNPCVNNELTFTASSELTIDSLLWEFGSEDSVKGVQTVAYTFDADGVYLVKLTVWSSSIGFTSNQDISIYENPICSFNIDTTRHSSFTRIFTDNSSSSNELANFNWDFGDGVSTSLTESIAEYKYSAEGVYTVWHTVIDQYGCLDSTSQSVIVSDIYIVPNVFTPNGDGINDTFTPTVNGVDVFSIEIFSRWGNLVFKREGNNQIIWDGTLPDGSKVSPGTYFYVISAHDAQKTYDPETGFITIFYENGE